MTWDRHAAVQAAMDRFYREDVVLGDVCEDLADMAYAAGQQAERARLMPFISKGQWYAAGLDKAREAGR